MKKVALVGFSNTTRGQAPWDDPETEIWGCNEGYVLDFPRIDAWFQLHSYNSFSRADNHNDPNHFAWLQKKHPFPIYMQRKFKLVPSSIPYPIDEIRMKLGFDTIYATSSFAYMMLYAIYKRYDEIGIYGFEMATDSEYFHQRANAEFLIGFARGLGIKVNLPENGNLLRGRLYAYEDDSIGIRQQLEFRKGILDVQFRKEEEKFYHLRGRAEVLEQIVVMKQLVPDMETVKKAQEELINQSALGNTVNGALKEVEMMIKIYDVHNGSKVVEMKEGKDDIQQETTEPNRTSPA